MTHTQPEPAAALPAAAPPPNDSAAATAIAPRAPLPLLAETIRLYSSALPELITLGGAGYLLLLLVLLPVGWAYQTTPLPAVARPAVTALLLVGGLALLAMVQTLVTTATSLALQQKQQAGRVSVTAVLRGTLARWGSLLALLAMAMVLVAVAIVVAGVPIVGTMLSPGILAVVAILTTLAPVVLTAEPLRGAQAMARAWGLVRPHLFHAFGVLAAPGLLSGALISLPAMLMLGAGLSLQLTDVWLLLLPGVFLAPLLGVSATQLAADLRRRAAASGIEPPAALHTAPGHGGLLTLAEAGQLVVLSLLVIGLAGGLLLAGWGVWQAGPLLEDSPAVAGVTVGSPAPDFWLDTAAGQQVSLAKLAGKPVVINFWATWCPPCKEEMPALEAAYQQHGDHISFLAVNVQEDKRTVNRFVRQYELSLPVPLDIDGEVLRLYGVRGLPTTVFVDSQGRVTALHLGALSQELLAEYLESLK